VKCRACWYPLLMTLFAGIFQFQKIQGPQWKGVTSEATGQVSFSIKASAISVNVTPILPRTFIRGSLARAQATLPLNAYAFTPITIDPSPARLRWHPHQLGAETACRNVFGESGGTDPRVSSLQIDPPAPAKPWVRSLLPLHGNFHNEVSSPSPGPRRRSPRDRFRAALGLLRLPILDRVVANHCSRVSSEAGEERSALERRGERS